MTQYMTRVELRGSPAAKDYENLHTAMENKGFARTIKGNDGNTYKLPHAMYFVTSTLTTSQIQEHASEAAASVWTKSAVLASEAPSSAWAGLDLA